MRAIRLLLLIVVLIASFALTASAPRNVARAQGDWEKQKLWSTYWRIGQGFASRLEMKNNRAHETVVAHISLYAMDGFEAYLEPVTLGPRQTAVVELNQAIESLPWSFRAQLGKEGTVEVEFEGPNSPAIMGGVTVTNPELGTAWNFYLYPERPIKSVIPHSNSPAANVSGSDPWWIGEETASILYVQNVGNSVAEFVPVIQYAQHGHAEATDHLEQSYMVGQTFVKPGEVVAIDIRALRDQQTPDVHGRVLPLDVRSGQIHWLRGMTYVDNTTVARSPDDVNLTCGDQVLIVGQGSNTVKTVTDTCPICPANQLDNYTTLSACNPRAHTDLGNFKTIRVNR